LLSGSFLCVSCVAETLHRKVQEEQEEEEEEQEKVELRKRTTESGPYIVWGYSRDYASVRKGEKGTV